MRIVICEDSALLRDGLVRLLNDSGHDASATGSAVNLAEVVAAHDPDLVILDVRLPPTWTDEGVRAAVSLRQSTPELPILVLSQYVEEQYAAELIAASRGSLGYLLKDRVADVADFLETVVQVASGATILDPEVVAQLLGRRSRDERMMRLTDRERAVLALLAEGRSNSAIAQSLHVSEGSVEKHITALFGKLGLEQDDSGNRRVLAALAHLEHGGTARASVPIPPGSAASPNPSRNDQGVSS